MVSLREASPEDAADMARIQSESLRQNAREEYTEEQLDCLAPSDPDLNTIPDVEFVENSCRPIVAEKDGSVVGWGSIHLNENTLAATFVDPDHTGEGIGQAIVEKLEKIAQKEGLEWLIVPASLNAVGFYGRLGFERQQQIDAGTPNTPEIPSIELKKELV